MRRVLLYIPLLVFAAAVPVRAAEEAAEAAAETVAAETAETVEAPAEAVELETPVQRLSYALGMEIAKLKVDDFTAALKAGGNATGAATP